MRRAELQPRRTHTQVLALQVQWTSAPSVFPCWPMLVAVPQPHLGRSTVKDPEVGCLLWPHPGRNSWQHDSSFI